MKLLNGEGAKVIDHYCLPHENAQGLSSQIKRKRRGREVSPDHVLGATKKNGWGEEQPFAKKKKKVGEEGGQEMVRSRLGGFN